MISEAKRSGITAMFATILLYCCVTGTEAYAEFQYECLAPEPAPVLELICVEGEKLDLSDISFGIDVSGYYLFALVL